MTKSSSPEIKNAINYLYNCSLSIDETEVEGFIKEGIKINCVAIKELENNKIRKTSFGMAERRDYFFG